VARFYLDEDVSNELSVRLRSAGHDVLTTEEAGLRASPDSEQLAHAWAEQRILVTHNSKHFLMLHLAWTRWPMAWVVHQMPLHSGIAIITQPPKLTHIDAATALHSLVSSHIAITNDIVSWRASGEWVPMRWRSSR
jgi:hypothetical protein